MLEIRGMSGAGTPDNREQALKAAFAALDRPGLLSREPAVPVTAMQWRQSLSDADLHRRLSAYTAWRNRVSSESKSDGSDLGRRLRPAVIGLATEAGTIARVLEILSQFDPGESTPSKLAGKWGAMVLGDAHDVLEAAVHGRKAPAKPTWLDFPDVVEEDDPRDVLLEVLGIPSAELQDKGGVFCDSRVLAFYRSRLHELQVICDPIMTIIAERPPSVFTAVSGVRDILTSSSPFVTLWTAREVRAIILEADEADPARSRDVLLRAAKDGDKEWESFRRMQDCLRRAETIRSSPSGTDSAYAFAILEAYRHMAEGVTRRWIGALLSLTGVEGRPPGLGGLAEPATARLGELGTRVASALTPAMRNAEAHDDVVFDEDTGLLCSGDTSFRPSDIEERLAALDVLQRGLILGRLAAFSDRPELGDGFSRFPDDLSASSALAFARQRFGHAGQPVRSFVRNRDQLEVELDNLRATACNPCFVALTQTARVLPTISRFIVKLRGRDGPIIDLPSDVLHGNWPVFEMAARVFFDGLPQSTFLPCLAWCRLPYESIEHAARFAAWFALNDATHAILDANASLTEYSRLAGRFEVVATAAGATSRLFPKGPHLDELLRAERISRAAGKVFAENPRAAGIEVLTNRIFSLRDGLGGPFAVLPTLDPTPPPMSSYPHETS